ncbi:hypothetical protein EBB07_24920 [Paenibacillaceae bacterium]|nr:hypothetical protein EBB07_24920 [Paenibacillaceae bacterium]
MPFYSDFPEYVPVAERRQKADNAVEKLRKKDAGISPVRITGRTIASTWWGKSWCNNLESYADYSNRIARGRSYVRHGAVLDLKLVEGEVAALVQGSGSKPYKVGVKISALPAVTWEEMVKACSGKIESLQELAEGKLPKALAGLFTIKGEGLFPSPKEISFSCSCPDGADMCKHVAAVLYGIGARLDEDSGLLFAMRSVNKSELITSSVAAKSQGMLDKSKGRRRRTIADANLSNVFGIDIESDDNKEK